MEEKKIIADKFIIENKHKLNAQYRLNYHLMGEYGWINDPNAFIQIKDKYNLFFQYYPFEAVWGPMYWGHAISKDLIKWEYLPIALAPDSDFDKDGCFSGSSIEKDDKMYLIYTGFVKVKPCMGLETNSSEEYKQTQCIAYSKDGINFTKSRNNPVIDVIDIPENASKKDFRDPKIFKIENNYYVIIGSNDGFNNGQVLLYKSNNLIKWQFVSIIAKSDGKMGNTWECPDLFELQNKDVLIVSPQYLKPLGNDFHNLHSSIYMVGEFDIVKGKFKFTDFYAMDSGFDFYAPQTIIDNKNRRIVIAWMDMWKSYYPTKVMKHNWAGAMTLPREVIIKNNKLYFKPIEEIKKYRSEEFKFDDVKINGEKSIETFGYSYELQVIFDAQVAQQFGLKLRVNEKEETILSFNTESKLFTFNRDKSGIGPKGKRRTKIDLIENRLTLRIFVDKSSLEVFINNGEKVMTGRIYPEKNAIGIKAFSKGECKIVSFIKWNIK